MLYGRAPVSVKGKWPSPNRIVCMLKTARQRIELPLTPTPHILPLVPQFSQITGEALVASGRSEMDIDVWITTVQGKVLYHRRSSEHGKFSFDTPALSKEHEHDMLDDDDYDYTDTNEEDTYKICIEHQQSPSRSHPPGTKRLVSFHLNQAFNGAKNRYGDAAGAKDTDKLQATMRDMHTTLSGMIGDLSQLQKRERTLTNRMQRTTSRITWLAVFSLFVTLATSALQFRYYKGYFKQKKLC